MVVLGKPHLGVQSAFGRPDFLGKIWDAIRYIKEKIADHSKTVSVLTSREIVLQNNLMQSTERATSGGDFPAISRQLEIAVEIGYFTDFPSQIDQDSKIMVIPHRLNG